jgi:hypothetical protein
VPVAEGRVRLHEGRVVLPRLDRADREDEALRESESTPDIGDDLALDLRSEPRLDPFRDHLDLVRIERVVPQRVTTGVLGDGDDPIGSTEEAGHHRP